MKKLSFKSYLTGHEQTDDAHRERNDHNDGQLQRQRNSSARILNIHLSALKMIKKSHHFQIIEDGPILHLSIDTHSQFFRAISADDHFED